MNGQSLVPALVILFSTAFAAGCGSDESSSSTEGASGSSTGGGATMHVMLRFEARVGDQAFDCTATYPGLGTASTEVTISDFRLYVHDVRLHQAGGGDVAVELNQDGMWQYQNVALLDFENKAGACNNGTTETNTMVHGMVPEGTYDGVSFKLGVPFDLDHGDVAAAPSPLNQSGLYWGWNAGYKFLRVDSTPTAGGDSFNLHVGSTGCMGDFAMGGVTSCSMPNVAEVNLTGYDPDAGKIVADYAALVAGNDLTVNLSGMPGCLSAMDDMDCGPPFQRLGIDITDGSIHPEMQEFFTVE